MRPEETAKACFTRTQPCQTGAREQEGRGKEEAPRRGFRGLEKLSRFCGHIREAGNNIVITASSHASPAQKVSFGGNLTQDKNA